MISIEIRFSGGRYHATPWGRHVNEGAVEWPPSPWRLLRALLAVWHRKHQEIQEDTIRTLIDKLSAPPSYRLPTPSLGHTRHYMPQYKGTMKNDKAMVFDAFFRLPRDARLIVYWHDVALSEEETDVLSTLLQSLSYLGRAESWITAKLIGVPEKQRPSASFEANKLAPDKLAPDKLAPDKLAPDGPTSDDLPPDGPTSDDLPPDGLAPNCRPVEADTTENPPQNMQSIAVLCPQNPQKYSDWRTEQVDSLASTLLQKKRDRAKQKGKDPEKVKLSKKDQSRIQRRVPPDLFACLHMETSDLQDKGTGWSRPPGTRSVDYFVPLIEPPNPLYKINMPSTSKPTTARFVLSSDTIRGDTRPQIIHGLYLSETTRQALMSKSRDSAGMPSVVFSGKTANGFPLQGHRHAYVLPCDDDNDGRIDHIVVYCREGFDDDAQKVLSAIRKLWQHKGKPDLFPVLIGLGQPEDFAGPPGPQGHCPALASASAWISRTPYLLTRHPKKSGKDSPQAQIRRDLVSAGLPAPKQIETISQRNTGAWTKRKRHRWMEFARDRKTGSGRRATAIGQGFRLVFDRPVTGPIALGYGAHFGLGLFWPEEYCHVRHKRAGREKTESHTLR